MSLAQNAYWMSALQSAVLLDRDPARIADVTGIVESLTAPSLQQALRRYLPLDRYTVVTLMPEAK